MTAMELESTRRYESLVHDEPIRSRRLVLVPLKATDAEALAGLLEESPLREWLRADDAAGLRQRFARWETRRSPDGQQAWLNWIVRAADDERPLGWLQATVSGNAARVAYALLPAERGAGVASEALRALVRWLTDRQGVSSVTAEIDDANVASGRVAAAAGFERTDRRSGGETVWSRAV
jgi:RimJ/RimL family protein N-acetyltransferase